MEKTSSFRAGRSAALGLAAATTLALSLSFPETATAAPLTYNVGTNLGWFATDAWTGNQTWTAGDSASFTTTSATIVLFDSSTTISGLTHGGGQQLSLSTSSGNRTLTFSGGTMSLSSSFPLATTNGVTIQGNLTITGASGSFLRVDGSTNVSAYSGTMTINNAGFAWGNAANVGANSTFVVNGGILNNRQSSSTVGSVEMTGGDFQLGRNNTDSNSFTTTVNRLSGTGGTITTLARSGNTSLTLVRTLTINQTDNTTFAGSIVGVNGGARIVLNKSGTGDLGLSGNLTLARQTTVSSGSLYINGNTTNFSNDQAVNGTAISVAGGTLGGNGTISVTDGDNVVLSATGRLAAGVAGAAGRTTYAFSSSTALLDVSAATASANTGWLRFELGGVTTAGVTYDQILLSSGTLAVGTGLNFADFNFTALSGFGLGTYVLFDTGQAITGSLGTATGMINGYDAELKFADAGTNLVLEVVPEPQVWILVAAGLTFFVIFCRRRVS